jgi:ribosomal protein L20A (L18A)
MGIRIELIEKYLESVNEDDALERLGLPIKKRYRTRRVNVHFDDIERIIETPADTEECKVRLYSGEELLIRESYDDMSTFITSLEHLSEDEDEEE